MECPPESRIWFEELEKNMHGEDMNLQRVSVYGYDAAKICADVRRILNLEVIDNPRAAFEILAAVEGLENEATGSLIPRPEAVESSRMNFRISCTRTFYCSFRMKLHLCVLQLLDKILVHLPNLDTTTLQSQYEKHTTLVQEVADELLAGIPGVFRPGHMPEKSEVGRPRYWTDGLRLLWPLRLITFWKATREDQRQVAGKTLGRIREELGILQAAEPSAPRPFS